MGANKVLRGGIQSAFEPFKHVLNGPDPSTFFPAQPTTLSSLSLCSDQGRPKHVCMARMHTRISRGLYPICTQKLLISWKSIKIVKGLLYILSKNDTLTALGLPLRLTAPLKRCRYGVFLPFSIIV